MKKALFNSSNGDDDDDDDGLAQEKNSVQRVRPFILRHSSITLHPHLEPSRFRDVLYSLERLVFLTIEIQP